MVLKSHAHFPVLVLEGAHDVLTPYDEVHDAGNYSSMRKLLVVATDGDYVHKLHESLELLVALRGTLQEFQLELLL